ncbi:MAG: hypothetical protein ACKVYV_13615 [Limisphaerales bacterium]
MAERELLSVSNALTARPDRPGRYRVRTDVWPPRFGAANARVTPARATPAGDADGAPATPAPAGRGTRLVEWARDWFGLPGNRRRGPAAVQPELQFHGVRAVRNDLFLSDVEYVAPARRRLSPECRARLLGAWWTRTAGAVGQAARMLW